jgi:hypothetical protein
MSTSDKIVELGFRTAILGIGIALMLIPDPFPVVDEVIIGIGVGAAQMAIDFE